MAREIEFRAWVELGDNSEVKGMVQEVVPYRSSHDGNIGAFTEAFNDAIKASGYQYADNELIPDDKTKERIDGDELNLRDIEGDWIFFDGELMQFTGLKDKKKKEIYEDDILKDKEGDLWRVIFQDGAFWLQNIHDKNNRNTYDWLKDNGIWNHVIVGNIHENPELLTRAAGV